MKSDQTSDSPLNMKLLSLVSLTLGVTLAQAAPQGIDVSSHQPSINCATVKANGIDFAYIKATEGTGRRTVATMRITPKHHHTGYTNPNSPASTPDLPTTISSAEVITSRVPIFPLARPKQISSWLTEVSDALIPSRPID